MSNAIKYSAADKPVVVTVSREHDEAVIAVRDEGQGISEEDQAHIFDRFYRTERSKHSQVEGLGLGLYIASEIVQQQGGRMWCESQKGEGSTFFFSLPLRRTVEAGE